MMNYFWSKDSFKKQFVETKLEVGSLVAFPKTPSPFRINEHTDWSVGTVTKIENGYLRLDDGLPILTSKIVFPVPSCLMSKFYSDEEYGSLEEDIQ